MGLTWRAEKHQETGEEGDRAEASPDATCLGLTVPLACSPLAHQHPRDGPRTASPQRAEQLQKQVCARAGCHGAPDRWDFSLMVLPNSYIAFAQAVLPAWVSRPFSLTV